MTRQITSTSKVVYLPRHLTRPPTRGLEWPEYFKRKYEYMFEEPWSALEERVKARHPELFETLIYVEEPQKMWWEFWK